jgi:glycolate oxidase
MAINREAYREIEDIVGARNISDDPAIKAAYRSALVTAVLPENTEQIAAVIKVCNKYGITFKGVSTGWAFSPPSKDIVYMDFRRMNRIIEINEQNMYAVVEPNVVSAELQAELFKRGLNCNIKGSGSNCTALALSGHGHMGMTTGTGDRNDLATEWVTDQGDIVKLGTLGASDEWFCGDGPGPSLRAVIRTGGIITKQAVKLYHWPGPAFALEGLSPRYELTEFPDNLMVRYYTFPNVDKLLEAELKIGKAEIAYELMGFCLSMVSSNISTSNEDDFATLAKLSKYTRGRPGFMVIIAGNFPEDFDYKKKVLQMIIDEAGGESLKQVEEDPHTAGTLLFQCIRPTASIRETFRVGGLFASVAIQGQRYDLHVKWLEEAAVRKRELMKKGLIVEDDGQQFGWGEEQGHLGHSEIFCRFSPTPESQKAVAEWGLKTNQVGVEGFYAVPFSSPMCALPVEAVGPLASNYHILYGKLKKAFDPAGIGELTGFSFGGSDDSKRHTSIYNPEPSTKK